MIVNILGINCSPREKSNSKDALEMATSFLKTKYEDVKTDIISLKEHRIEHCLACDTCGKTKDTGKFIECRIDDDLELIFERMKAADGFLVATPVYFGLPTDLFSKFIMRTRLLRHQDFALNYKVVGIIAIAARRSGGAETTIMSSWLPFIRNGCLIVGNGDKTCQYGAMCWAGGRGHVLSDEWGIEQINDTAERVYDIAKMIKTGMQTLHHKNNMKFSYTAGMR